MIGNLACARELRGHGDMRGMLIAVEETRDVPFQIRRMYFVRDVPAGAARGGHAHYRTRQLAVCVAGRCRLVCEDAHGEWEIALDRPDLAVLIEPMVWHDAVEFSGDCVLVVLASEPYEEADYIRTYEAYRRAIGAR